VTLHGFALFINLRIVSCRRWLRDTAHATQLDEQM
jgi:hypothetical protein